MFTGARHRVKKPAGKRLCIIMFMAIVIAACAAAGKKPLTQLSVAEIVSSGLAEIDLGSRQLVCAGKRIERLDRVDGALVKGVTCEEPQYMSFLYLFNDEPFFFAIMEINQKRDELKPLMGFGAMKRRGTLFPMDLMSKPGLPAWAFKSDGTPVKSIYVEPERPAPEPPGRFR
jgi:hypothetical protein